MKKTGLAILMICLCLEIAHAVSIGISPGRVRFDRLLAEGYAERPITITTNTDDVLYGHLVVNGPIAEWVRFEPDSGQFQVSRTAPYRLTIIIEPPLDMPSGNYSGSIDVVTDSIGTFDGRAGGIIKAAVTLLIDAEVTRDQLVECRAGAFMLPDTEISFPLEIGATVINDGNIRITPTLTIDIWDQSQEKLLLSREIPSDLIFPTTQKNVKRTLQHDLGLGQYWAKIGVAECKSDELLTFNIVEEGQIADRGILTGIYNPADADLGQTVEFTAQFENQGQRAVSAKFKGNIKLDDTIVKIIDTEEVLVDSGAIQDFEVFFTPQEEGRYTLTGRVLYNKKLTFEKGSVLNVGVVEGEKKKFAFLPLALYLIIIVTILFIIRKIVKERKRKD